MSRKKCFRLKKNIFLTIHCHVDATIQSARQRDNVTKW